MIPLLSVVIPVHNEEVLLEKIVRSLLVQIPVSPFEIILVENGSDDRSAAIAQELSQDPRVRSFHQNPADYGLALRRGLLEARGEWIINFSVDFIDCEFLSAVFERRHSFDLCLGSKYLQQSRDCRPLHRKLFGRLFSLLAQCIFHIPFRDPHGLKLFRASALKPIIQEAVTHGGFFENEVVIRAWKAGLRISEAPLAVRELRPSRSKNLRVAWSALAQLIQLRFRLWLERL